MEDIKRCMDLCLVDRFARSAFGLTFKSQNLGTQAVWTSKESDDCAVGDCLTKWVAWKCHP